MVHLLISYLSFLAASRFSLASQICVAHEKSLIPKWVPNYFAADLALQDANISCWWLQWLPPKRSLTAWLVTWWTWDLRPISPFASKSIKYVSSKKNLYKWYQMIYVYDVYDCGLKTLTKTDHIMVTSISPGCNWHEFLAACKVIGFKGTEWLQFLGLFGHWLLSLLRRLMNQCDADVILSNKNTGFKAMNITFF